MDKLRVEIRTPENDVVTGEAEHALVIFMHANEEEGGFAFSCAFSFPSDKHEAQLMLAGQAIAATLSKSKAASYQLVGRVMARALDGSIEQLNAMSEGKD